MGQFLYAFWSLLSSLSSRVVDIKARSRLNWRQGSIRPAVQNFQLASFNTKCSALCSSRTSIFQDLNHIYNYNTPTHKMICRRCLTSASSLTRTIPHRAAPVILRSFASTTIQRNAAPAAAPAAPSTSENPTFSTPLGDAATAATAEAKPALSACAEGTVLNGLNYLKNKTDPVALADDAYPAWLWSCLDVTVKKSDDAGAADAEAEFCTL
jgi:hypothetical protein